MENQIFSNHDTCQHVQPPPTPDIFVDQQPARHVYSGDFVLLTVLSCASFFTAPVHLTHFFSFYYISMTNIKEADDAPLSEGERVGDARIISRQSEITSDTETSQSLSDESHTVYFPCITEMILRIVS